MASTLGMVSRIYYNGKDHTEIFTNGKYHNAIFGGLEVNDHAEFVPTNNFKWEKYPKDIYSVFDIGCVPVNVPYSLQGIPFFLNSRTFDFDFLYTADDYNFTFNYNYHTYHTQFNQFTNYLCYHVGGYARSDEYYYWTKNFSNTIQVRPVTNFSIGRNVSDRGNFVGNNNIQDVTVNPFDDDSKQYLHLDTDTNTVTTHSYDVPNRYTSYAQFEDNILYYHSGQRMLASANYTGILGYNKFYSGGASPSELQICTADYIPETRQWIIQVNRQGRLRANPYSNSWTDEAYPTYVYLCDEDISNATPILESSFNRITRYFIQFYYYVQGYYYFRVRAVPDGPYNNGSVWRTPDFVNFEEVTDGVWTSTPTIDLSMPTKTINADGDVETESSQQYRIRLYNDLLHTWHSTIYNPSHSNTTGFFVSSYNPSGVLIYLDNGFVDSPRNMAFRF